MTAFMKDWHWCPHCHRKVPNEQPFDTWCRNQPGLDSLKDGIVAYDNDLIINRFRFDSQERKWQCLMFIEVKSMGHDIKKDQQETLGFWSQLMDNMHLANPGDLGPCFRVWSIMQHKEIFLRSYGVHCLRLEKTTPDNSAWMEWDWKFRISPEELVGILRFERDPEDPKKALSMDEKFKRTNKPAILTEGQAKCDLSLIGK